jgi:protein AbiQ
MKIRQLTSDAYNKFSSYPQVLRKEERGYGLLEVTYQDLIFAIPLRSNMNHSHGFKTIMHKSTWCGLDYSKALITKPNDFKSTTYKLRDNKEFQKIKKNKDKITEQFGNYVLKYMKAYKAGKNTFHLCGYTTLEYFHKELGL